MRVGDTAESLVDRACAAAMQAATEIVAAADAEIVRMTIRIDINGAPAGEDDACSAAMGFEDSRDFAAHQMADAIACLKAHGINAELHAFDTDARSMS